MARFKLHEKQHRVGVGINMMKYPYWQIHDTRQDKSRNRKFVVADFMWDRGLATLMCAHLNYLHDMFGKL